MKQILVINPGSTSTKIAVFSEDGKEVMRETIRHSHSELENFHRIIDQYEFRVETIMAALKKHKIDTGNFRFIVGRGGLLKPLSGGTWIVNEKMIDDLKNPMGGEHASNLGAIIAYDIARPRNIPAYIVDPIVVDELEDVARISGIPQIERVSIFHALNQKAVARRAAADIGKTYSTSNLIVVHLGGGISVGAHKNGKVIDVNNALNGDGPFSPERSGGLPTASVVELCFSGKYTAQEIKKLICGKGGLKAYLGTTDVEEAYRKAVEGDSKSALILDAMMYQTAREIGALATVFRGEVDAIAITGGIAFCSGLMEKLVERIQFIAPVKIYPGENEMESLFEGAMLSENGKSPMNEYI